MRMITLRAIAEMDGCRKGVIAGQVGGTWLMVKTCSPRKHCRDGYPQDAEVGFG
ncbi:MAG: hypothetical protein ACK58L_20045 [Planctomycetota bacterium]